MHRYRAGRQPLPEQIKVSLQFHCENFQYEHSYGAKVHFAV